MRTVQYLLLIQELPMSKANEVSPQAPFNLPALIEKKVQQLPADVPEIDPYKRRRSSVTPVNAAYDRLYSPDGRVEFGTTYNVRRLVVGQHELAFAHNRKIQTGSAFLVSTFFEQGGLAQRVWFQQDTVGVSKRHETGPWPGILNSGPGFRRFLDTHEVTALEALVNTPTQEALTALVTPSEVELTLLEESATNIQASLEDYRQSLEEIAEAQREAWKSANEFIIG